MAPVGRKAQGREKITLSQMWFLRSNYKKMLTAFSTTGMKWLEQLIIPDSLQNIRHRLNESSSPKLAAA